MTGPVSASELASGLDAPWGVVPLADGTALVAARASGEVLRVDPETGDAVVVGVVEGVLDEGEGGLLGLAITDDEQTLVAYLTTASDNRVVTIGFDGERLGEPTVILDGIPRGRIHDGGRLLLGPDELLYVATGDAGQGAAAQDPDSLGGKILRITLDGEPAPDNPFGTVVYSLGHRNVQGLALDDDGGLWASELGQNAVDELNAIVPGSNYGWPIVEGEGGQEQGFVDPVVTWSTADASPSGLTFWRGSLWMAALRGERLWQIPVDGGEAGEPVAHLQGEHGRLRTVVVAPDGEQLWVTTSNTGRDTARDGDDRLLAVTG